MNLHFGRREIAGSLGDLGTLLPIAIGLILINGLDSTGILVVVGAFYVLSGLYFRTTVPVQPMKVIGAYAIAGALSPVQIATSGMFMGLCLLLLAATGLISIIGKLVPRSVVRGVQLTTGVLLIAQGIRFVVGNSSFQVARGAAEPFLSVQSIGPVPIGIILGVVSCLIIFILLENRIAPAALVVVLGGVGVGLALGVDVFRGFSLGLHIPSLLPFGWPSGSDIVIALTVLALPQLPMTVGNAVIAQADLTREYFGPEVARRCTFRGFAVSMGLANVISAAIGGMPVCHGAGGLAAHYRFGARTAGSNLMIGLFLLIVAVLVGDQAVGLLSLIPFSVLGALLIFAGAQLSLMIQDVRKRSELFVTIAILGVSIATNLGIGFGVGIILAYAFRYLKLRI